jgi:acyl-CoA thioester hydrolase
MTSIIPIQLRYGDTDQMGVVYHANYFPFFELGRLDLLKQYGHSYHEIEASGLLFPIRDVQCTYLKSLIIGKDYRVKTKIHYYTKVKIQFQHEIIDSNDVLHATGYTTIVCVDRETFKLKKIDQKIPGLYQSLLKEQ